MGTHGDSDRYNSDNTNSYSVFDQSKNLNLEENYLCQFFFLTGLFNFVRFSEKYKNYTFNFTNLLKSTKTTVNRKNCMLEVKKAFLI